MKHLTASELTERVVIQTVSEASDGQGGVNQTSTTLATVWARVRVATAGDEAKLGGQVVSGTKYVVTMWLGTPTAAITTKHQATWRGKTLNIASVTMWPDRSALDLLCAEVSA